MFRHKEKIFFSVQGDKIRHSVSEIFNLLKVKENNNVLQLQCLDCHSFLFKSIGGCFSLAEHIPNLIAELNRATGFRLESNLA